MSFWVGWPLWEKLSFVLGLLIVVVFVYASCVLAFNRWMTRRYAAAETRQKDQEAELYPMLSQDDVPFGAKALERGVQVEGIWVANHDTPHSSMLHPEMQTTDQTSSPDPKKYPVRPPTPASSAIIESARHTRNSLPTGTTTASSSEGDLNATNENRDETRVIAGDYTPATIPQTSSSTSTFGRHSEGFTRDIKYNQKRASFHTRILHTGQVFDNEPAAEPRDRDEIQWHPTSKDIARASGEQSRPSRISRLLRKRSSEEFRRRMSAIFNERIHMSLPSERLEIDPMFRATQSRHKRKSILTQTHSWNQ